MPMDSQPLGPALESITVGHDSQGVALQDLSPRRDGAQPVPVTVRPVESRCHLSFDPCYC